MIVETKKRDVVAHPGSEERIALFLEAVFEDGNPAIIAAAMDDIARARRLNHIAECRIAR